jgi:hypothetical protein
MAIESEWVFTVLLRCSHVEPTTKQAHALRFNTPEIKEK